MQKTQHLLSSIRTASLLDGLFRFYSTQDCRLKDLSGYVSGSHFIPKMLTTSVENFVSKVSQQEIDENLETTGGLLRSSLNLKSVDYESFVSDGMGVFECSFLKYEYYVKPNEQDLSKVIFFSAIIPLEWDVFVQEFPKICDLLYPIPDRAVVELDKPINIPQFIHLLEEQGNDNVSDFQYDTQKNNVHLSMKSPPLQMHVTEDNVEFLFTENNSLQEFLRVI